MIRLVIFDIAGTIIEDHGEVVAAFGCALREHGISFTAGELEEWKGASKRDVIRHFVERQSQQASADEVERVYCDFRKRLEQHYRENGVTPIAGAAETFAWLREHGIRMATTSGFYHEIATVILETAGWRDTFAANVSSSDVAMGRPAPYMIFRAMESTGVTSVREVVNVGDTPLDLQAGTNAGARGVVGVLSGLHQRARLEREPHTHLVASVAALPALLESEF